MEQIDTNENSGGNIAELHEYLKDACQKRKDEINNLDESTPYEQKEKRIARRVFNELIASSGSVEITREGIQNRVDNIINKMKKTS